MYTISMERYLKLIFSFFLLAAFLFEGLGINNGREVAYYLILLMPFFLFMPQFVINTGKKIIFPLKFSILFFLFIVFSLLSSIFSVNLQNSFQDLFLYIALFLIFIFVFNYRELVKSAVLYLIFALSFIFSIFSLFITYFITQNSLFSIPVDLKGQGYQFIYSVGGHNHLGDFLLLSLTVLLFWLLGRRFKMENLLLLLFFIPYFIFSYSRSAYLDLAATVIFIVYYLWKENGILKKNFIFYVLGFTFTVVLAVFLFAVPTDTKKTPFLNSINSILQEKYDLGGKRFFAYRNYYATEGLFSLANKPLFGVGPGNFEYASQKYLNNPVEFAPTTHNLFFDIFVENGLLAGIFFILLFLQVFHSIIDQLFSHQQLASNSKFSAIQQSNNLTTIFIFIFIVMLFNFQTDYTFLIRSFFLLFFVVAGLIYSEKRIIEIKFLVPVFSLVLFLIFNLIIFSNLTLSKNNYLLAFYSYPLNKDVYVPLINSQLAIGNRQPARNTTPARNAVSTAVWHNVAGGSAFKYLNYYVSLFKGDPDVLNYAGNVYYGYAGQKEALAFYEKAFSANNFEDPALIKRIYEIKLVLQGQKNAREFADKYFLKLSGADKNSSYYQIYYGYRLAALKVCREIYNKSCPYSL